MATRTVLVLALCAAAATAQAAAAPSTCACTPRGSDVYGSYCASWDAADEKPWCTVASAAACGEDDTFKSTKGHYWAHRACKGMASTPPKPADRGAKPGNKFSNNNNADKVDALHEKPLLHFVILSAAANIDRRDACRETWLKDLPAGVTASFMVLNKGLVPEVTERLYQESVAHGDIRFVHEQPGYYQLTHSTMSAMTEQRAAYIMKCDDDTFVRVDKILVRLRRTGNPKYWLWGTISSNEKVFRSGKWGISKASYPHATYPPFAHGPGYVISGPLANWLAAHPMKEYIKLEDVATAIAVNSAVKAGVPVKIEHGNFPLGCSHTGFIAHYVNPAMMRCLYRKEVKCCPT